MREIYNHRIYELLNGKYNRICCDYIVLSSEDEYKGIETHKSAVVSAFEILRTRFSDYDLNIGIETDKMSAVRSCIEELLKIPPEEYFANRKNTSRSYSVSKPIPYWYAFLEPPGGTPYDKSDFLEFNKVLFPDKESTEVYCWNDDFSNYFDAGKEWWGTGLWSIYDSKTGVFTIIGASMTD